MGYASVPPPLFLDILHPRERGALVPDEDKGVYSVDTPFASSREMGIRKINSIAKRYRACPLHPRARGALVLTLIDGVAFCDPICFRR